jgi:hypothetical protein
MSTCYQRHARARFQREIYNLPLLGSGPKSTDPTCRPFCLIHEHIVRPRPVNEPEGKTERLRHICLVDVRRPISSIAIAALSQPTFYGNSLVILILYRSVTPFA